LEITPGITPVNRLINTHRDIVELTYTSIGIVADLIINCFKEEKVHRISRANILKILKDAVTEGHIQLEDLHQSVRTYLQ
jgi:hypothetical protein